MKANFTELVFILDRSGSMAGLESDTIGGYNALLEKQKETPGDAVITTILFDDKYEILHDRIQLEGVMAITKNEYFVCGSTALLDAVGKTIKKIENAHNHTAEAARPSHVLCVITTDGMENSSREYTYEKIKEMIETKKKVDHWEFLFLGANIDAVAVASNFGIDASRASNYHADSEGTALNYMEVSNAISELRLNDKISDHWKANIESDYAKRSKKKIKN